MSRIELPLIVSLAWPPNVPTPSFSIWIAPTSTLNAAKQLVELDVAQGQVEVTVQHAAWGTEADAGFELAAGHIETRRVNLQVAVFERDLCLHMLERQLHRLNGVAT